MREQIDETNRSRDNAHSTQHGELFADADSTQCIISASIGSSLLVCIFEKRRLVNNKIDG